MSVFLFTLCRPTLAGTVRAGFDPAAQLNITTIT
jgi:hypothetical protein